MTAEGVETEEEATILRIAGCNAFQGFFFGRPAPAAAMTALLGADARLQLPRRARSARLIEPPRLDIGCRPVQLNGNGQAALLVALPPLYQGPMSAADDSRPAPPRT